jgi:hypothetical protein
MSDDSELESSLGSFSGKRRLGAARINRRAFVQGVAALPVIGCRRSAAPPVSYGQRSELDASVAISQLHASLSAGQRRVLVFPFDDERRTRVDANWSVTSPDIESDFFSTEQRWLIDQALRGLLSEDAYERTQRQMADDWGGLGSYSVALFGDPATRCQWQLTGRHVTLRAWGSAGGKELGGPIVYGHGQSEAAQNLFFYQTREANRVFAALSAGEQARALGDDAPDEDSVALQGMAGTFAGLPVRELATEQRALVDGLLGTLCASFHERTATAIRAKLEAAGGTSGLSLSFYREDDLDDDRVWDIWRLEGPAFVWHFRGAPHVHAYVNMGTTATGSAT